MIGLSSLDVVSCNTLINWYCKRQRIKEAYKVFNAMSSWNIIPDTITYNTLIDAFYKVGEMQVAEELLLNMKGNDGPAPNINTINIVINGLCMRGHISQGLELFQKMESKHMDIITYNTVLETYCKAARLEDAMHLFHTLPSKDVCSDIHTYAIMIGGLYILPSKDVCPDTHTYAIMIGGLFRGGNFKEADTLFEKMEKQPCFPDSVIYNIFFRSRLTNKKLSRAKEILMDMRKKNFSGDTATKELIVDILCEDSGDSEVLAWVMEEFVI